MYKSPIEKIYGEIQIQMVQEDENMVMKAIRKVGVNVDKDELIKALQYDRNQYTKGYEDGKNDVLDKIRTEILAMMPSLGIWMYDEGHIEEQTACEVIADVVQIIDKYKAESEG